MRVTLLLILFLSLLRTEPILSKEFETSPDLLMNGVVINEIVAENENGEVDEEGDAEPWIELFNNGPNAVNLSDHYLTDDPDEPFLWQFPNGTILQPNQYLIIWADDDDDEGPLHATFKLEDAGGVVQLIDDNGNVVDFVNYGAQPEDIAYARVPNGTGPFINQGPTFAATNSLPPIVGGIVINEILVNNVNGETDETGLVAPWLELYNTNAFAVDISGYHLSDEVDSPGAWAFPSNTIMQPDEYLIVWVDDEDDQGPLHTSFELLPEGGMAVLSDAFLRLIDTITFGPQIADTAFARVPNGTGPFIEQQSTFNANNDLLLPVGNVVINEIMANNETGNTDEAGDFEDWIELFNTSTSPIDLSGYYLTDDSLALNKWSIPANTILQAKGYLIVWADNEPEDGPLHATFRLAEEGEKIILSNTTLEIIDSIFYDTLSIDTAFARVPNGTGPFIHQLPTFNASNDTILFATKLVINEIMADNETGATDEAGDVEDWIELYNYGATTIDLSGFFLSNDTADLMKWEFPLGTLLQPDTYLIVWPDNEPSEGSLHLPFRLSNGGETLILSDTFLVVVDSVSFGTIAPDTAFARVPNGTGPFVLQLPTFAANNNPSVSTLGIVINELMAENESGAIDESGDIDDWIELYNTGTDAVDISGWYLSDDPTDLTQWTFPAGTILQPDSYLVVWADDEEEQGPLHTNFRLTDEGESLILSDNMVNIMDSLTFGVQFVDTAFARIPNGTGPFVHQLPTFAANNETISGEINLNAYPQIEISPNPFNTFIQIQNLPEIELQMSLLDITGKIWATQILLGGAYLLEANDLPPGFYFLSFKGTNSEVRKLIKL